MFWCFGGMSRLGELEQFGGGKVSEAGSGSPTNYSPGALKLFHWTTRSNSDSTAIDRDTLEYWYSAI